MASSYSKRRWAWATSKSTEALGWKGPAATFAKVAPPLIAAVVGIVLAPLPDIAMRAVFGGIFAVLGLIVALGVLLATFWFRAPSAMDAAKCKEIEQLESALAQIREQPKPLKLGDARGLIYRLSREAYRVRMMESVSQNAITMLTTQIQADLKVVVGYERAARLEHDFRALYTPEIPLGDRLRELKKLQLYLYDWSERLAPEDISREMGSAEYVDQRLGELRPFDS